MYFVKLKLLLSLAVITLFSACSIFGSKQNDTVDDIFKQGNIDPNLVPNSVSYVPIYPYITNVRNPLDVMVGYDELVYVIADNDENTIEDNELMIFNGKAELVYRLAILGATDITQDRRLHTYIAGRYYSVSDKSINLAAVYHIENLAAGKPKFNDTLKHFSCDESRRNTAFRGQDDIAVQFTGLATLFDNTLYLARTGPRNDVTGIARPDNGVLFFNAIGENIGFANGLTATQSSLKSAAGITSIATQSGPPQRLSGISTSPNFYLALGNPNYTLEYRAIGIQATFDPDQGLVFGENSNFLNFDNTKANRFLYESFRFKQPTDIFFAPDANAYIFVTDKETDSLYVFTNNGFEGVNPPANSNIKKQIIVSFGGSGSDGKASGPFNFVDPSGVCYYRRMVLVADKGNNRICRYMLNTDIQ
jgi:hypothetical protein